MLQSNNTDALVSNNLQSIPVTLARDEPTLEEKAKALSLICPTYEEYTSLPVTLSFSMLELLRTCPRKYELHQYLNFKQREESIHFDYGSAVGDGVQALLAGKTEQEAIISASLAWKLPISNAFKRKNWDSAIHAIKKFQAYKEAFLADWELLFYLDANGNKVPATELKLRIRIAENMQYAGAIDLVMRNTITGEYAVFDIKTTGSNNLTASMKQNSEQALGYAIVLRELFNVTSFTVFYIFLQANLLEPRWAEPFMFGKTSFDRLAWLYDMVTELEKVKLFIGLENFPTHGNACYNYGKDCMYLGRCHADNASVFTKRAIEDNRYPEDTPWAIDVSLEQLIDSAVSDYQAERGES